MMAAELDKPPGDLIREKREKLGMGLRQAARLLDKAPSYLLDLEKGRRTPSEPTIKLLAAFYSLPRAVLMSGWGKADGAVRELASENPTAFEMVPRLLRAARHSSAEQYDEYIEFICNRQQGRPMESQGSHVGSEKSLRFMIPRDPQDEELLEAARGLSCEDKNRLIKAAKALKLIRELERTGIENDETSGGKEG